MNELVCATGARVSSVKVLESHQTLDTVLAVLRAAGEHLNDCGRYDFESMQVLSDLCELIEDEAEGKTFWVGVYLEDRAYGGREEGGWWYEYGVLQTARWVYEECGVFPSCHPTRAAARIARDAFEAGLNRLNSERRSDIGSVLSEGRFVAVIFENELAQSYPTKKPHYD